MTGLRKTRALKKRKVGELAKALELNKIDCEHKKGAHFGPSPGDSKNFENMGAQMYSIGNVKGKYGI